jgi:hypothetical protein
MSLGSGAGSGAAAGSAFGPWGTVIGAGIGALTSLFGMHSANKSNDKAAQLQYDAAMRAAQLQATAQAQQLDFLKAQEAQRQKEFADTQTLNKGIYDQDVAREQGRYDDLQARMAPYRQFGVGALGQFQNPIYPNGSIQARMGG